jgi:sterol desaturase/sphingolipid hydroxylase (fatty acid hydroxylase superfamily)
MDLQQSILEHEPAIRITAFFAVFALVAVLESVAPRRELTISKVRRWTNNLALLALNTFLMRIASPLAAAGFAAFAAANGWGLLNHLHAPLWIAVPFAVIALDFVIWLQHVVFHAVPALWRLHRVHHADPDFDLTTGTRFHPIEMALSMAIKFATIAVLGPPVLAVVIFEGLLNATAMFNHGNVHIPSGVDRLLRWFVVTPDMHRVHHSIEADETNSNFGFNLPWWDRLFGTYRAQPQADHTAMTIGVYGYRDPAEVVPLAGMLRLPFRSDDDGYSINRRTWRKERTA